MQDTAASSCSIVNGSATHVVAVADRGLAYGDGLFETIVWRRPHVELQSSHIERLLGDCQRLQIPLTRERFQREWQQLVDHLETAIAGDLGVIKIIVTRGEGERGYKFPTTTEPTLIFNYTRLDADPYASQRLHGVRVRVCDLRLAVQPALAGIKHLNRLEQVMARAEWNDPAITEGLLLDQDGFLVEATMSNVLYVSQGELYTPTTDRCGVSGVMARYVTETVAPALGIKVNLGRYRLEDFLAAEEWLLTSSMLRVCPINALGSEQRVVGPLTKSLQTTLDQVLYA